MFSLPRPRTTRPGITRKGTAMTGDLATGILTSTTFELPGDTARLG
jgi:hypothetical protein